MNKRNVVRPLQHREPARHGRKVFIRDLVLYCLIGVHRHERDGKQRVRINIDLTVADDPVDDRLSNIVSYETLIERLRALANAGHINLVETFAERIAELCLVDSRIHAVRVRVEKLDVFADASSVGVEIERSNRNR